MSVSMTTGFPKSKVSHLFLRSFILHMLYFLRMSGGL